MRYTCTQSPFVDTRVSFGAMYLHSGCLRRLASPWRRDSTGSKLDSLPGEFFETEHIDHSKYRLELILQELAYDGN